MTIHKNLRLTAKLIPIIAPFIGRNDIRYYLCGINVRPHKDGGAVICATNGHAMGVIYDRDAVCDQEVTLRLDVATVAACAARPSINRYLSLINNRLTVTCSDREACIQADNPIIDYDKYPNYLTVVPKNDAMQPGMIGGYSEHVLALINRAATAAMKSKSTSKFGNPITFFNSNGDAQKPVIARIDSTPDFIAVLMPMRSDAIATPVPEWIGLVPVKSDLEEAAA